MRRNNVLAVALALVICFISCNSALALSSSEIFKKHASSVVTIYVENRDETYGLGSGFFVEKNGMILTNSHVIANATDMMVRLYDGRALPIIKVVAQDPEADLALIQVGAADIKPLVIAQKLPDVGETVTVIGAPAGYSHTLTDGSLSAVGRGEKGKFIQISAPISPGSSGSPVFNSKGEVIGVATLTDRRGQNLNFAPSIVAIKGFLTQRPMMTAREYTIKTRTKSPGQFKAAYKGDILYKAGEYKEIPSFDLLQPIKSTLPGTLGIHFWFEITRPCTLNYVYSLNGADFFAAPQDAIRSTFSGSSVIAPGDYIGVFRDQAGGMGWFVDNSKYNGTQAIWTRPFKQKEFAYIEEGRDIRYNPSSNVTLVTYEGINEKGMIEIDVIQIINGRPTSESGVIGEIDITTEIPGEFNIAGGILDIDRTEGNVIYYDWTREPY